VTPKPEQSEKIKQNESRQGESRTENHWRNSHNA